MKKDSPIGFFDSGVGGLSVYSKFRQVLPHENTIYFGDLKNLPYGNKTKEELITLAKNILNFFDSIGVKSVVIACNTSSALAYESIKNEYKFKIYPIIQSCAKIIAESNYKKLGVFATIGTVNSKAYSTEIAKYNPKIQIKEIACPKWVSIVEGHEKDLSDIKIHIDEILKYNPEKIILGCTHYPYLIEDLSKFVPKDFFIDPAKMFVEYIQKDLEKNNLLLTNLEFGKEEFFVSASPESFIENSKIFYNVKTIPTIVDLQNVKLCKSFV